MLSTATLSRFAVAAVVAGLSVSAAGGAAYANNDLDNIFPSTPKRTQKPAPVYRVPSTRQPRRVTPRAQSGVARRILVGTWTVRLHRGGFMAIRFLANGTYYLINSRRSNVIEIGRWGIRKGGTRLVLLPAGVCLRRDRNNCRRYQNRKPVHVTFRIVNRNRVIAPAGVFTRHV